MFALGWLLVMIRFIYKTVMRMDFGLDDWMLLATALVTVPQLTIFMKGTLPNGLGTDIWTLPADRITDFLMYWYISAIIYFLQTSLLKLAFVAFYMRIFTTHNARRVLWATFIFVALWGFSFVMVAIFVCQPISYLWTQWDGLHDGKCLSDAAYVWTNAASNIALDVWILAIPLWEVRKLQLHWKKKLGVALMFGLGAFVTVMSILRLKSLVLYQQRNNVTWEFAEVYIWSAIEIGVGIICACLPTIRLLLVRIWPVLSGSTARESNQWYKYSNKKSEASTSTTCSSNHWRSRSGPEGVAAPQLKRQPGIEVENSFTLQFTGGSDISLILMKPENETRRQMV
ncbi:CFEM domain-containing protein [Sarocladium implicatum]|nr:CFEM domain-containing protein [Sarocladium implicatum]